MTLRVCVTGATGFVGRVLVARLFGDGAAVRALARPSVRADALETAGVEVVRGDIADADAVERAVAGAEIVYHTAAKVSGPGSRKEFMETNLEGTQRVFEACIRQRVPHVVYLSSIAVYGPAQIGERIDEDTLFDAHPTERDSYSHSKMEADGYAVAIGQKTKLRVTILRPGVVYGPGRPLPIALLGFKRGKTNFVFGKREERYPLTYVENLVDAIELAGRRTDAGLHKYIVIDDDNLTLGDYHEVLRGIEKTRTLFFPGWPLLVGSGLLEVLAWLPIWGFGSQTARVWRRQIRRALQDRWYDSSRIRQETGWSPQVPLQEAIKRAIATPK